jgi:hypothetical protein
MHTPREREPTRLAEQPRQIRRQIPLTVNGLDLDARIRKAPRITRTNNRRHGLAFAVSPL